MKILKYILLIIFINVIQVNAYADNNYLTPEDKVIYILIQKAYTKETAMYYRLLYINKKFNGSITNLDTVVNRHKQNISLLDNIMQGYDIQPPEVQNNINIDIISQDEVCKENLKLEQGLNSFYDNAIQTLSGQNFQQNDTIGLLINTFKVLSDNAKYESSYIFKLCGSN